MKYWALSSGVCSWAVKLYVRDLGRNLDITRWARAGTLADGVAEATSQVHMAGALLLVLLG